MGLREQVEHRSATVESVEDEVLCVRDRLVKRAQQPAAIRSVAVANEEVVKLRCVPLIEKTARCTELNNTRRWGGGHAATFF